MSFDLPTYKCGRAGRSASLNGAASPCVSFRAIPRPLSCASTNWCDQHLRDCRAAALLDCQAYKPGSKQICTDVPAAGISSLLVSIATQKASSRIRLRISAPHWCAPLLMRTPSLRSAKLRVDRPPGCVTMKWLMWKCSIGQTHVDFRAKWFLRERRLTKLPHRCSCPYVAAHFHEQLGSKCC